MTEQIIFVSKCGFEHEHEHRFAEHEQEFARESSFYHRRARALSPKLDGPSKSFSSAKCGFEHEHRFAEHEQEFAHEVLFITEGSRPTAKI